MEDGDNLTPISDYCWTKIEAKMFQNMKIAGIAEALLFK